MKKFSPLPIIDLLSQVKKLMLLPIQGRKQTVSHLARLIERRQYNNALIIGRRGVGKTRLIYGLAQAALQSELQHHGGNLPYLLLKTNKAVRSMHEASALPVSLDFMAKAFASLPPCVFIIDDAEPLLELITDPADFDRLFAAFTGSVERRLLLIIEEEGWPRIKEQFNRNLKTFDTINLPELSPKTCRKILDQQSPAIARAHTVSIEPSTLDIIIEMSGRLPSERSEPDKSLRLLDEVSAAAAIDGSKVVTPAMVEHVVASRLGLPTRQLSANRQAAMSHLPQTIKSQVLGQDAAVDMVSGVIQRGMLGVKNPNRPIGSFLLLGPSGVGKTELAKVLAKEVYGTPKAFIRIDMSEFSDAHTAQRLTGAPPGYVGYEAGGQLTNPIMQQPFSLILLDEIEKAHPTVFDMFLQVLDDGRLTDGQGRTVDFRNAVIIATSNLGIKEIVTAWQQGQSVSSNEFMQQTMQPLLRKKFRLEFLNRFEGMAVFEPFKAEALMNIAKLEIRKIEQRLSRHHVTIQVSEKELQQAVQKFSDPHLGARPLKRFIEERCETLLSRHLLSQPT